MRLDQGLIGKITSFIDRNATIAPVIVQESPDRFRVNDVIVERDDSWHISRKGRDLASFSYKSWAIAYAVALVNGSQSTVNYLQNNEQKLSKLMVDRDLYRHHRDQALKRNDDFKACIIEDRLSRTEGEIFELLDEAQQVLLYQQIA